VGDERELGQRQTAWVRGATDTKIGRAILTTDRLLFFDQKFMGGAAGGVLGVAVADALQRRHEDGGPLLELPLESVTRIARQKKLLNKDRIALVTADGEFVFNDGWKEWSPLLRDALTNDHGRRLIEEGPDSWRFDPH
jgi:hypothetical protein